MTAIMPAPFKEYSIDAFSQAVKNGQIKPGHALQFITVTEKSLTLPFENFYENIKQVGTTYIDTKLYEPLIESFKDYFNIFTFKKPTSKKDSLDAFRFEHIIVHVNKIAYIKVFKISFTTLRIKIMIYYLQALVSKDLHQIIKDYLPEIDVPDGSTAAECLAHKEKIEKSERQVWSGTGSWRAMTDCTPHSSWMLIS